MRPQRNWKLIILYVILIVAGLTTLFFYVREPNPLSEATVSPSSSPTSQTENSQPLPEQTTSQTAQNPPPVATDPEPTPPPATPGTVLNLTNWKLTLPVNTSLSGNPDTITQPLLKTYVNNSYFYLNSPQNGVIFQAHAGGATTGNSAYPRSELREMTDSGTTEAKWSSTSGTHSMTIRQAITHLPEVKPHVVAGQIHDADDDIVMIRLENKNLFVQSDGENIGTLDSAYQLGTTFTIKITASGGVIKVLYNDQEKVSFQKSGSGLYFKAGCYVQTNTDRGDSADAYGQVIIYDLKVTHS